MARSTTAVFVFSLLLSAPLCVYSYENETNLVRKAIAPRGVPMATSPIEGLGSLPTTPAKRHPGGDPQSLTVGTGCTYPTIGLALSFADPGDELLLEGGRTFVEIIQITSDLVIRGGYDGCASGVSDRTTLDGFHVGTVVQIDQGLDVELFDLVITNGLTTTEGGGILFAEGILGGTLHLENVRVMLNQARWGGGIWVGRGATLTGADVSIEGNTADEFGGGIRLYGGNASFNDYVMLFSNTAPRGAGVYASSVSGYEPTLTFENAQISSNRALTGDGQGGGVYLDHSRLVLNPSPASGNLKFVEVSQNEALSGGAIYMVDSIVEASLIQTVIDENEALDDGGGIYAVNSSLYLEKGVRIEDNMAGADYASGDGGGLFLDNSELFSSWTVIYSNTAMDSGAGIFATNGSTIEMEQAYFGAHEDWSGQVIGNQAHNGSGGGMALFASTARLSGIPMLSNHASIGGAIYAYSSSVIASSCTIKGNGASDDAGDGIRLSYLSSLIGRGLTIVNNDSESGTGVSVLTSSLDLGCSIVYNHATSIDTPGHTVTYCDIEGGYPGTANMNIDPIFEDSPFDGHLQVTSPLIDRCPAIATVVTDIDGEIRPWTVSNAQLPFDMGSDEVSAPRAAIFFDDFESGDTSSWSLQVQ